MAELKIEAGLKLHTASFEEIRAGKVTDIYFERTRRILEAKGIRKRVRAEFTYKGSRPQWFILAGIEECVALLQGMGISVRALEEGTVFYRDQPVMEIEGDYNAFGVYETALLGFICQASGIATKAARCKKLAGERLVISFGARRMHPAIAPMIERNAYIGGCDGFAAVKSSDLIGEPATGTIPHALVILMGSVVEATKAFDEVIEPEVKRVALVDTFADEKFEAVAAAEALGERLWAVRLDTPSSRRGDFLELLHEVRWELDRRGFDHVKIIVSGGLSEESIPKLNPACDGYGVGTSISSAAVVDFSMDIVEVEGEPIAKRGKWSGAKRLRRCRKCRADEIVPLEREASFCTRCGGPMEELLTPLLAGGQLARPLKSPQEIREYVLSQIEDLPV